jgi:hypothetical protein
MMEQLSLNKKIGQPNDFNYTFKTICLLKNELIILSIFAMYTKHRKPLLDLIQLKSLSMRLYT